jgi:hypothetical protein
VLRGRLLRLLEKLRIARRRDLYHHVSEGRPGHAGTADRNRASELRRREGRADDDGAHRHDASVASPRAADRISCATTTREELPTLFGGTQRESTMRILVLTIFLISSLTPALAGPFHHHEEDPDQLGWVETYPLPKGSETGVKCIGACRSSTEITWKCGGYLPTLCIIDCGTHIPESGQNSPAPKKGCVALGNISPAD